MASFGFGVIILNLVCALVGVGIAIFQLWNDKEDMLVWVHRCIIGVAVTLSTASFILLYALWTSDFSLLYVANYTDKSLPVIYRITAFWAGQAGSLLFWALLVGLCGLVFLENKNYISLASKTKLWYAIFFLLVMAFFALLLGTANNPFELSAIIPEDGNGLNPLLQNPGMILHPPLLFLGFGAFVIPSSLALAQAMYYREKDMRWHFCVRNYTLIGWTFLTAGILLGGWWAYMELGWGGYWAWDPVENASLIPWFFSTAAIHFGVLEARRNKAQRLHIFFMGITTVSAFFATWLTRGNVVASIHAFGSGIIGPTLFGFIVFSTILVFIISLYAEKGKAKSFSGLETREGFLIMTAAFLVALSVIVMLGTLWPVISKLWSEQSIGLDASFYNSVCLPLFTILVALLLVCPWIGWNGGVRRWNRVAIILGAFLVSVTGFWFMGIKIPLALISASLAIAAMVSMVFVGIDKTAMTVPSAVLHGAYALIVLGIAFSGPYKVEHEVRMIRGGTTVVGPYEVELVQVYEGYDTPRTSDDKSRYQFLEAELKITKDGKEVAIVSPQRRIYTNKPKQAFSEAATHPSLGVEFYSTLLGVDEDDKIVLHLSATPLVIWVWIGSIILFIVPFFSMRKRIFRKEEE